MQLGPHFRYGTLFAASAPLEQGTLGGDLWAVTSGDPSLRSADLQAGVNALRAQNITAVSGRVAVDGSAIAGEEINPLWNSDDANEDFMAATSGASIDEDTVEFRITGMQSGSAARVQMYPASAPVKVDGEIATGDGDDVTIGGTDEPNRFHLSGSIPPGVNEKFWLPVHGIEAYLGAVISGMLHNAGIRTGSPPSTGTAPLDARILWQHRSRPLQELLKHMLVESDNHYAEQIMRTLGGSNGDTADDRSGLSEEALDLANAGNSDRGVAFG